MDLLDLTLFPELATLLASFFSFKVEGGVMDSMNKAHFKIAIKGLNRLWVVLQSIHPLLRFQKTCFLSILIIFSENGKKCIWTTAMDPVIRAPKKIRLKLTDKKFISGGTTLPPNALKIFNVGSVSFPKPKELFWVDYRQVVWLYSHGPIIWPKELKKEKFIHFPTQVFSMTLQT